MKKAETQEQEFLEVCSSYDHDLLTGKKEMTLKDYERITYLVSSLGYSQYLQFLIGKYMDLAQADEEREEREHEIYLEYPEYYIIFNNSNFIHVISSPLIRYCIIRFLCYPHQTKKSMVHLEII